MTRLADVVETSGRVTATASRLGKVAAFAELLKRLDLTEIDIVIPFLSGEPRQGRLSVPFAVLRNAQQAAAEPSLTVQDVDGTFEALKAMGGEGVAQRREAALRELFVRATPPEQDFLARLIVGELRQGALEGVMLDAVAAAAGTPAADVRRAATFAGALAPVARAALEGGAAGLQSFSLQLMRPVMPMLAHPAADAEAAMVAGGQVLVEWKLDGARVQVHKDGEQVKVFTRSLKEVTAAVPEVVSAARAAPARSLVLDGEAIALRPDGKPHPFQDTMRRFGRKQDDAATREGLPLSVFFFDCMLADGQVLIDLPLEARRAALERAVLAENVTPAVRTTSTAEATAFYERALDRGHEGVMVKALDSAYEAGRRGGTWFKVKRAHTLDLVVLAAEWGSGRRKGWLSNLHLGARDPATGGFVMLGKTFKGLTDATLAWQTRELLARETGRDEWTVRVRPELVVEIAFNDIQRSPHYPGGMALRFARVKGYRPDKAAAEADTIDTVRQLFEAQAGR